MFEQLTIANIAYCTNKLARIYLWYPFTALFARTPTGKLNNCKLLSCVVILSGLSACSGDEIKPLHMSNPAADYCVDKDGTLETIKHINGDVSLCTLPDGEVIEQWELFRRDHQQS
ncbi:DUF333 domain-containing protein [Shewanella sp. 10N.286.51.B7]|uniref:putative hemolysin n=1 Tax=Shewanella sp. 10N.286.51.B7 TaxID=1880836 RepID=UPI000C824759|nr:DUF333 domain-containing protein [Shewanella sp. 10N.286.51.B7]